MKETKKNLLTSLNLLIAGIGKRFSGASLTLASQAYTGSQLVAALTPLAQALSATSTAKAAYQKAVASEKQAFAGAQSLLSSLTQAIYASFGNSPDALADFGLAPRTRSVSSAAVKAAAAAKAKATKEARGEIGKVQRAKIEAPAQSAGSPVPPPVVTAK